MQSAALAVTEITLAGATLSRGFLGRGDWEGPEGLHRILIRGGDGSDLCAARGRSIGGKLRADTRKKGNSEQVGMRAEQR